MYSNQILNCNTNFIEAGPLWRPVLGLNGPPCENKVSIYLSITLIKKTLYPGSFHWHSDDVSAMNLGTMLDKNMLPAALYVACVQPPLPSEGAAVHRFLTRRFKSVHWAAYLLIYLKWDVILWKTFSNIFILHFFTSCLFGLGSNCHPCSHPSPLPLPIYDPGLF